MNQKLDQKKAVDEACLIVEKATGVQFGPKQQKMVESRLQRRLSDLGLKDFSQYLSYLRENFEKEKEELISLLTTHHTYFFREFVHFEFLESALPNLMNNAKKRGADKIEIWSAACSRGQEVYSLAMHIKAHAPTYPFHILGTDVDRDSVKVADNGVYKYEEIKEVPLLYLGDHWSRGTGNISDFVKAKKTIRENCEFLPGNLLDLSPFENRKFDLIFCRNVFIYFTLDQVKLITDQLRARLHPGGILIIGLSESLHGLGTKMKPIGPSVYQMEVESKAQPNMHIAPVVAKPTPPTRVLCIDDSKSILALMKKILVKEKGFEVVGTAENGEIGAKLISQLKPDLITLDLHMPVCGGIDYLKKYHNSESPPVVIVSSVNREDTELAQQTLKLGASDYVEKPALNNLKEKSEELYAKLRTAVKNHGKKSNLSLDASFSKITEMKTVENAARILLCKNEDLSSVVAILKEGISLATFVAVDGSPKAAFDELKKLGFPTQAAPSIPGVNAISVGEISLVRKAAATFEKVSLMVIGSPNGFPELLNFTNLQILVEDLGGGKGKEPYASRAEDIVPITSFSFLSTQFFSKRGKKSA
jgi:chemotaxis protein methyltransferase CheR